MTLGPPPSPSWFEGQPSSEDFFLIRVAIPLALIAIAVLFALLKPPRPRPP